MKSKIYSSDYVKTTSKGQVWIPVFLTIGFLMAFPVAELLALGNWFGMNYESAQIEQLYERFWRDGFMASGLIVIAVAALINGINNFWYLYSSKKVDFYHSLPVKRPQMFWHRTYVGVLYYLVPYLVMEFFSICIGAMRGFFSLKLMKLALAMLVLHLLMYLLLYFSVVLVICMTGNMLMGALCLAAVFTYGPVLGEVVNMYQQTFFTTFFKMDYGAVKILKGQGSPFLLCKSFLNSYTSGEYGGILAVMAVLALLLGVAAYFAYVKRPSESTGKSMIYHWSESVIRLMVVIPSGLGVGMIFYMMPNWDARVIWWIFGMLVGTVLAHGIIEVVYQMDFRKFLSHKLQLVLAAGVVAVCALVFNKDLVGYDRYLPEYDELEGISISMDYSPLSESVNYVQRYEDDTYYVDEHEWTYGIPSLKGINAGLSQGIYTTLKSIIAEQGKYHEVAYMVPVKYVLKSGKVVYRQYQAEIPELHSLIKACYEEGTLKERRFSFLNVEDKYLQWIRGTFCDGESYVLFQDDRDKVTALLEALKKDVEEADADTFTGKPCASLYLEYENLPLKQDTESVFSMTPGIQNTGYVYADVKIYPEFTRTLAILKETGYPISMDNVELEYVKLTYFVKDQDGNYVQGETEKIDDKKQLDELKKCINYWENLGIKEVSANMKTKEGHEEVTVGLIESEIPDFVKKNMERAENGQMQSGYTDGKDAEAEAEPAFDDGSM